MLCKLLLYRTTDKDVPIPGFPDFEVGISKEFLGIWNSLGFLDQILIPDFISCVKNYAMRISDEA